MSECGHVDVVFSPQTGGYSYVCELSEMGRTFSAVVTSSTATCNVSAVSISQAERESPVRLVWRNGPMNFTIESSTVTDQRGLYAYIHWLVQEVAYIVPPHFHPSNYLTTILKIEVALYSSSSTVETMVA